MDLQQTSDAQPLTQDGGNCLDMKMLILSTRKEKLLKFKQVKMLKTETLSLQIKEINFINSGISFILMNTKKNQKKGNSMKSSDSM